MPAVSPTDWESFIVDHPQVHLLQTPAWGMLKSGFGWQSVYLISGSLGAQVLFRSVFNGLRMAYVPKGPVGFTSFDDPDWTGFIHDLDAVCRSKHAVFAKIEPDAWQLPSRQDPSQALLTRDTNEPVFPSEAVPDGFRISRHSIQPQRTLVVDLRGTEEAQLACMKQKTRYNIRLAQRHGVAVSPSGDVDLFYRLLQSTGERDQFGIHSLAYYRRCYELFQPRCQCELLIAFYQSEPLAALMVFAQGSRAWYFYGASSSSRREFMPTYLLQWEAMRWARRQGCTTYDLWGVPDADETELEEHFSLRSQGLWGVYRFKRGFGGNLLRLAGPWDRVYLLGLYRLYRILAERRMSG